jgi:hypothetical protein
MRTTGRQRRVGGRCDQSDRTALRQVEAEVRPGVGRRAVSTFGLLVVGTLAILSLAVVGWFLTTKKVPERASEHDVGDAAARSFEEHRGDLDGDPGAEAMDPRLFGGDQSPPGQ